MRSKDGSASGLKTYSVETVDSPSINTGVNIKHTFINPDIYVGEPIMTKNGGFSPIINKHRYVESQTKSYTLFFVNMSFNPEGITYL
jgi:hypothetical protein